MSESTQTPLGGHFPVVAARQQVLPLDWGPEQTLTNFDSGERQDNLQVIAAIRALLDKPSHDALYVWGDSGSGKTHLLRAACHAVQRQGRRAVLLGPDSAPSDWPEIDAILALPRGSLLAVDDVGSLGHWQQDWLFGLYNAARAADLAFLACGDRPPAALALRADLRTRLSWGLALQLSPPDDAVRARVLHRLAQDRGYALGPELVQYMLTHLSRDLRQLARLMHAFDRYALALQRPATVPLLKSLLAQQPELLRPEPAGVHGD